MFSLQTIFGSCKQFYGLLDEAADAAHDSAKALHAMMKASDRQPVLDAFKLARQRERATSEKIGKALVDEKSRRAVVILPQGMVPADKVPQLSLPKDGQVVTYETTLVIAPPNLLDAPTGKTLASMLTVTDMSLDPRQPKIAGK